MARLRSPEGCPWDREQNYETLAPMLLEEAYEVFDAVDKARKGAPAELRDELGDLLFLIVFYAQLGVERGDFSIDDVSNAVHTKMVRRHPHVFGDVTADNSTEVLKNWETIKADEKRARDNELPVEHLSLLDDVPFKMPALMEARQLSKKAANVGFDWERVEDIFEKIQEEISELREAVLKHTETATDEDLSLVRGEVGDLLFAVTNVARHLHVEPEGALKLTNQKFRRRFAFIEKRLNEQDLEFNSQSLDQLESLWQEAKTKEKRQDG
jgi:MazG family protein